MKIKIGFILCVLCLAGLYLLAGIALKDHSQENKLFLTHHGCQKPGYIDSSKHTWQGNNDHQHIIQLTAKVKVQNTISYSTKAVLPILTFGYHSHFAKSSFYSSIQLSKYLAAMLFPFHYYW